jgi:hypothetical protein
MAKNNYLVSVFVDGRNVDSYFSENLDDLVTIKAMHKGSEISIFDLQKNVKMTEKQVIAEINKSVERWKKSMETPVETKTGTIVRKKKREKVNKFWERPVRCVETGQVFATIRKCSNHFKISYKSIWNAINSGRSRHGLHFESVKKDKDNKE